MDSEIENNELHKFLFNEICALCFQAGVGRLKNVYVKKDEERRRAWRCRVKEELRKELGNPIRGNHSDRIQGFIDNIKDDVVLKNGVLTFGVAQKILNLFLKYIWALGWTSEPASCPVDSRILRKIGMSNIRWSKMTREQYDAVMNCINTSAGERSHALWELEEFEAMRP